MRQLPIKVSDSITLIITDYNEDETEILKILNKLKPNLFKEILNETKRIH